MSFAGWESKLYTGPSEEKPPPMTFFPEAQTTETAASKPGANVPMD